MCYVKCGNKNRNKWGEWPNWLLEWGTAVKFLITVVTITVYHLRLDMSNFRADEDVKYSSCQPRTEIGGHQNWTAEDWETWPGMKTLDLCWGMQMVGWVFGIRWSAGGGGVMVWEMFYWLTLHPLIPINHDFSTMAIVDDHMHPFIATIYHPLMASSSMIKDYEKVELALVS